MTTLSTITHLLYLLHIIIRTIFKNTRVGGLQTFKICEKQEKSTRDWKGKPPISSKWWRIKEIFLHHWNQNTWKRGGEGMSPPNTKKIKLQLGQNAHVTQKPQIFYILQTVH